MIGKLTGVVDSFDSDHAIIDVHGVGYLVHASARTLRLLPAQGNAVSLIIETHVREDHIHLYGFADSYERDWFRLLTTVQGVGTRMALAILSVLEPEAISTALAAEDKTAFTQASGVGPKLAQRIITELKGKLPKFGVPSSLPATKAKVAAGVAAASTASAVPALCHDATSALVNLGYGQSEAWLAVQKIAGQSDEALRLEQLIPLALKELA